ncbi:hypothetical protein HZY93_08870 [Streptococcus danieliae]|uniref:Uncharacterized protein n=2 Tax=Streptococcus danieliae TaxID=747656 RepID=A0A7Z0LER4_9STRE|nr:hypothetical protein [Streptococcus danieliae]NYS49983.1 hypothetical protein [Streptococcus danieliae]
MRQYLDTDLMYNQSGEVFWIDEKGQSIRLIYSHLKQEQDNKASRKLS